MQIADRLGETQEQARQQFVRTVRALGRTQSLALQEETLSIEANGGLMLPDGSRRRTAGGVFFFLARTKGQPKERPWLKTTKKKPDEPAYVGTASLQDRPSPPTPLSPSFTWADRLTTLTEIGTQKGTASTLKITLIGRPGRVIDRGTCIVTTM